MHATKSTPVTGTRTRVSKAKRTNEDVRIVVGDRDVHLALELRGRREISREVRERIEAGLLNFYDTEVFYMLQETGLAEVVVKLVAN